MFLSKAEVSEYPFPKWHPGYVIAIERAIKTIWNNLKSDPQKSAIVLHEEEHNVTEQIQLALEEYRISDLDNAFNRNSFGWISPGGTYRNFDGTMLKKQPDLVIRLQSIFPGLAHQSYNAIFIECKIIGEGRSVGDYIQNGIRRFVDGEYAWAMRNTIMLAYVRNLQTLPTSLRTGYKNKDRSETLTKSYPINGEFKQVGNSTLGFACITCHNRNWRHPDYGDPGFIEIQHFWLK